jgi:hypothetical protein
MSFLTVEVRWFLRAGSADRPAILDSGSGASTRTDWYAPSGIRSGIKLREGNLEPKLLLKDHGPREVAGVVGRIQSWQKWTYSADAAGHPPDAVLARSGWIPVTKRRELVAFEIADGEPTLAPNWPDSGCHFEWTEVSVGHSDWLTVGFEAFGRGIDLEEVLVETAQIVVPDLPVAPSLREDDSYSYAEWLTKLRATIKQSS